MDEKTRKEFDSYEAFQKPSEAGYVVIGAGLPRTGTMSTRHALGVLLEGKCHHMLDAMLGEDSDKEIDFWLNAADGKLNKEDWVRHFEGRGYRASVDAPSALFYRDLMEAFPNAKVVLTVRRPETWYKSVSSTIYKGTQMQKNDFAVNLFCRLQRGGAKRMEMLDAIAFRPLAGMDKGFFEVMDEGPEASEEYYKKWVETVKAVVPNDRLLVFDVKQGWEPLCKFLGVPEPDIKFPHSNDTAFQQNMHKWLKRVSYAVVYGIPVLASCVAGYFYYRKI